MISRRCSPCLLCAALTLAVACGGSSPTSPNRNPTITNISISPSFGVSGLTTINMSATASDPDGGAVTYQWTFNGTTVSGASTSVRLTGDGAVPVQLRVTSSKGGTSTETRNVTIGTMTGRWAWTTSSCGQSSRGEVPGVYTLNQSGGTFTGTVDFPGPFCNIRGTNTGWLVQSAPGTIDEQGNVTFPRVYVKSYQEFNLKGRMDATGRTIVGAAGDSGFSGDPFTLVKQ